MSLTAKCKVWFKKNRTLHIEVIQRDSTKLALHEYRSDRRLVTAAEVCLADPRFALMLQVARNVAPEQFSMNLPTPDAKILQLGVIQGYHLALNNLESMAVQIEPPTTLEATFEADKKGEE